MNIVLIRRLLHATHQPFQKRPVDCHRSNIAEDLAWAQTVTSLNPLLASRAVIKQVTLVSAPVLWPSCCPAEQHPDNSSEQ
jgi:hypothetical protein